MIALPNAGVDADRLLREMQDHYPLPVWSPSARLGMTAHSRATDLRKLGWSVVAVSEPSHTRPGRRRHGFQLVTPRDQWPRCAAAPTVIDAEGQVRIA